MKHQKFRNRVTYARRNKELVAENEAIKLKIRRFAKGYKRVVKKLLNLRDKYEDVVTELEFTEANLKELHKDYTNICNANMELEQRVHQLMDEYNDVVRQLDGNEKRKDKDQLKQTLGEFLQMHEYCEHLKKKNEELERFAKAIHSFVKDKKIYMEKGTFCGYMHGFPAVCSSACLECESCLGVIDECGVICRQVLYSAKVKSAIQ